MEKKGLRFKFCLKEEDARIMNKSGSLYIDPLADTRYVFTPGMTTGDMTTPGIGIAKYNISDDILSGGVMTRKQIIALRDFLEEWCNQN